MAVVLVGVERTESIEFLCFDESSILIDDEGPPRERPDIEREFRLLMVAGAELEEEEGGGMAGRRACCQVREAVWRCWEVAAWGRTTALEERVARAFRGAGEERRLLEGEEMELN